MGALRYESAFVIGDEGSGTPAYWVRVCRDCGSVVHHEQAHDAWHKVIEQHDDQLHEIALRALDDGK